VTEELNVHLEDPVSTETCQRKLKKSKIHALQHLPWAAQLPHLNIIEPLWSVSEIRVRARFPLPMSPKQLEHVLQEEWYKIQLETVQNLYESIPRRTASVGPTLY
jgi:hypothetical protein